VDEERFQALIRKRDETGLSDEEADELGRLLAEKEGEPYGGSAVREEESEEVHGGDEPAAWSPPEPAEARDDERGAEEQKRGDIPPGR
jgi:hypothetical protein